MAFYMFIFLSLLDIQGRKNTRVRDSLCPAISHISLSFQAQGVPWNRVKAEGHVFHSPVNLPYFSSKSQPSDPHSHPFNLTLSPCHSLSCSYFHAFWRGSVRYSAWFVRKTKQDKRQWLSPKCLPGRRGAFLYTRRVK